MANGFDHAVLVQAPPRMFYEQCDPSVMTAVAVEARRVRPALQRELPARAAVGTMGGDPTYVEGATEGTGCLRAKLERAIDCMRLIAGRTARPSSGISIICERCSHRSRLSCSVAALWRRAEAIGLAAALR